jgi:hypothetical protein
MSSSVIWWLRSPFAVSPVAEVSQLIDILDHVRPTRIDQKRWAQWTQAERHDVPGLIDELVPSVAAVVDNVAVGFEDPARQPVSCMNCQTFSTGSSSGHLKAAGAIETRQRLSAGEHRGLRNDYPEANKKRHIKKGCFGL